MRAAWLSARNGQPFGISGEAVRQDLDGDLSAQVGVLGSIDFAHASSA
jgi:hypothetical protein